MTDCESIGVILKHTTVAAAKRSPKATLAEELKSVAGAKVADKSIQNNTPGAYTDRLGDDLAMMTDNFEGVVDERTANEASAPTPTHGILASAKTIDVKASGAYDDTL